MTIDVIHVGGTSIKGLSSDPTIDINIVVDDLSVVDKISEKLLISGYKLDTENTESDQILFKHNKSVPHSLQIVEKDSLVLKAHLLLKKHLEENPASLNEYETLKKKYATGKITQERFKEVERKLIEAYLSEEGLAGQEMTHQF